MQAQGQALFQSQKLKLSPQMLQSIKIMSLPLADLKEHIDQELNENPALEIIKGKENISLETISTEGGIDNFVEESYFANSSDPGFYSSNFDSALSDRRQGFLDNTLTQPESLQEHLIAQLHLQNLSEELIEIGTNLIRNLDENGFHLSSPKLVLEELGTRDLNKQELQELLEIIQHLEPVGCCTSDYRESLEIQAGVLTNIPTSMIPIIRDYLPDLNAGRVSIIAKSLSVPSEEVEEVLRLLKYLTPYPGREYSNTPPRYIIPDLTVYRDDGQIKIVVNEEEIPVLGISPSFNQRKNDTDKSETWQFIQNHVRNAQSFILSIQQRQETLKRAAIAIVEYQRDFFLKGPKSIVSLTLKVIADELGVHEATISRLTRGKYMQTDFGIFELKYFFTNAVPGQRHGGGNYGKVAVKAILKEILQENRSLSDQKLADLLAQRGINIARRTVAKYRSELNISSSYER